MIKTKNDLPEATRAKVIELLNARLAIDEASELGDQDTADVFTEVSRGIDKWL